jgi:diguanylate cyclase (GGDEF)-like protein
MLDISVAVHKHMPRVVQTTPKPLLDVFINLLRKLFHEKEYSKIYEKNHHLSGLEFVDSMLENLNITYTVKPTELRNIPSTGKIIIVANHPNGGQETMSLIQAISGARENKKVKLLANSMLMGIKQIAPLLIPVDNINGAITKNSIKAINEALENDEAVIIFPAGIVNRLSFRGIKDTPWKASFLKIAQKTKTPILPIRVKGRNSTLFYISSLFLPKRVTGLLLPHEFATAHERGPLHLNIGRVVPVISFSNPKTGKNEYIERFYKHLYRLGTYKQEILETEVTIGHAKNRKYIKEEIKKGQFLGFTNNDKKIVLVEAKESPFILGELGRIRELSYRAIGGSSGNARDNDIYDDYYKHLILWDDEDLEIIGAYRIGECKDIVEKKGQNALYSSNWCYFNEHFDKCCNHSVELGRGFVQPKYWGSRAFDSLWQAVTVYLAHNTHIQYSYGVITINSGTPPKATAALAYFYMHHFACNTKMMTAKNPYVLSKEDREEFDNLFSKLSYKDGFIILKKYLKSLGTVVPTLFKQYVELYEQGAVRYFDFSVNERYGVVDGFIIADNYRMKKSVQDRNLINFKQAKTIDSLTNLHTGEHFVEIINSIKKYRRKTEINSILVSIQIDNFNSVSQEQRFAKDRALQKVAKILKKELRDSDIIAREKNEKFTLLLKNITKDEATMILEKLRASLDNLNINGMFRITCSFGATPLHLDEEIQSTFEKVFQALEEAVSLGGNRVIIN